LSVKHNVPLYLDRSFLDLPASDYTKRDYELDQLTIQAQFATEEITAQFKNRRRLSRIFNLGYKGKYFSPSGNYDPQFEKSGPDTYLDGYWQSENYFKNIRHILLKEFSPAYDLRNGDKEIISGINDSNSVGVHVRRGDYVNLKSANEFHGVCGMDYYSKAISLIKEQTKSPVFFIFSDDPDWCKENFKHIPGVKVVQSKSGQSSAELFLMSMCKHNIIANSSYSWWSGWLNTNETKMVIAPKNWFASANDSKDILPKEYILL
jgi:hypothetical protein